MDALFQLRYRPRKAEICTYSARYRAHRQALKPLRVHHPISPQQVFRLTAHRRVQPTHAALHQPATLCRILAYYSCSLLLYYTTTLCDLQGTFAKSREVEM